MAFCDWSLHYEQSYQPHWEEKCTKDEQNEEGQEKSGHLLDTMSWPQAGIQTSERKINAFLLTSYQYCGGISRVSSLYSMFTFGIHSVQAIWVIRLVVKFFWGQGSPQSQCSYRISMAFSRTSDIHPQLWIRRHFVTGLLPIRLTPILHLRGESTSCQKSPPRTQRTQRHHTRLKP